MIILGDRFTCNLSHKASSTDNGTKVKIITENSDKYSISQFVTSYKFLEVLTTMNLRLIVKVLSIFNIKSTFS